MYGNNEGIISFVLDHVWGGFWLGYIYALLVFTRIRPLSDGQSWVLLVIIVLLNAAIGIWFQRKRCRNEINVLMNLCGGYGLYNVLAYFPVMNWLILLALLVAASLSILYTYVLMHEGVDYHREHRKILRRRRRRAALGVKNIFSAALGVILIYTMVTHPDPPLTLHGQSQESLHQTIANNIETLTCLHKERWGQLSDQAKLDILQVVADIERTYLGLPDRLTIKTQEMDWMEQGMYKEAGRQILINREGLSNRTSYELVETVTHEVYHCYQYRMVQALEAAGDELSNLRFFKAARVYQDEFHTEVDASKNFREYYYQKCEMDARSYSQEAARDYFSKVYAHMGLTFEDYCQLLLEEKVINEGDLEGELGEELKKDRMAFAKENLADAVEE